LSAVGLPISFMRKAISQKPAIIGLPKGLFYFQHHTLWENFLKNIGCQVVVSEDTNQDIMDYGVKHCSNETCLPVKVFHGHVYALKDKVDYIFIPRYTSVAKNEYACPKFAGLPDMTLLNLKKQVKILEVKLHLHNSLQQTHESLKDISKILNIRYKDVEDAFMKALNLYDDNQKAIMVVNTFSNGHPKIAVLGHPYMIYDNYLSMRLIKKLTERNINVLTPASLEHKTKRQNAYPFQGKAFLDVGFDNLGSAFTFAEDKDVNGIIYLTPFACGLDSIIIEFIERRLKSHYNVPFLKLTIDEHTGEAGFDTRLEAFLDMME
jgi:predicted nucleotide-binding protein (sugar kinase/HSP70/actin superfamily)